VTFFTIQKNGSSASKCLLARNFRCSKLLNVSDASAVKNYKAVQNKTEGGVLQQAVIPGGAENGEQAGDGTIVSLEMSGVTLGENVWLSSTVYILNARSPLLHSLQGCCRVAG